MKKKPTVDPQDLDAFQNAMKGVKRIRHDKIPLTPQVKRKVKVGSVERSTPNPTSFDLNESTDLPKVSGETPLSYHQPGIPHKTLRNLRKGQYNVEAVLDLHGMTTNEAKTAVSNFLRECISDSIRVVLIIHGKGRNTQPILKNKLNQWLRGITQVLAFCTASATHGSRGAMYILLKRMQQEEK